MASGGVRIDGLKDLVKDLKGPLFRAINADLRASSKRIAADMMPDIAAAVRRSAAPQAHAMADTLRPLSDRVPVVVMGRVNPKFTSHKFGHKGESAGSRRRRRGAMALGVVAGPAGATNYYKIGRDDSWGPLGAALRGPILKDAEVKWLEMFIAVMRAHGYDASSRAR